MFTRIAHHLAKTGLRIGGEAATSIAQNVTRDVIEHGQQAKSVENMKALGRKIRLSGSPPVGELALQAPATPDPITIRPQASQSTPEQVRFGLQPAHEPHTGHAHSLSGQAARSAHWIESDRHQLIAPH